MSGYAFCALSLDPVLRASENETAYGPSLLLLTTHSVVTL